MQSFPYGKLVLIFSMYCNVLYALIKYGYIFIHIKIYSNECKNNTTFKRKYILFAQGFSWSCDLNMAALMR